MNHENHSRRPAARKPSERGLGRAVIVAATIACLAMAVASCSDDDPSSSPTTPSTASSATTGGVAEGEAGAGTASAESIQTTLASPETTNVTSLELPTTTAAPTTTIPPTTTTTLPLVTDGALVLVANATGMNGAAGRLSAAVQAVGYATKPATNAAGDEERLDVSKIYFLPAAEAAAQSLGLVMQIESVSRMPTPAPIDQAQEGLADATILIMLGNDLAGKDIPGFAGR